MEACPHLATQRADPDDNENWVSEKSGEDVMLAVDLSGVDLVKQRHEHERVEDHCKML